jgi:hypothetical protein
MLRVSLAITLAVTLLAAAPASAQDDPVLGNWRGTLKSAQSAESPIIITIVRKGDGYAGTTTGLSETSELPLRSVTVRGNAVSIVSAAESQLGQVTLTAELTGDGAAMKGTGALSVGPQRFDVTFSLQRRARRDVVQPRVEQRIDYFTGRWRFEYVGADYPPLSAGTRNGTVTFTRDGTSNFARGQVEADVAGRKVQERLSIGFDPEAKSVVLIERRSDGLEMVSLGNWRSPLAISFLTSPVQDKARRYQLRRVISVTSDSAFEVTEEFSVDGGPFRRLGNGRYTKVE